jgi:hypothetical protein
MENQLGSNMPYYSDREELHKICTPCGHAAFDFPHAPGTQVDVAGIYQCVSCGFEIISDLPSFYPQQQKRCYDHPAGWQADAPERDVNWRLVAAPKNRNTRFK